MVNPVLYRVIMGKDLRHDYGLLQIERVLHTHLVSTTKAPQSSMACHPSSQKLWKLPD